MTDKMPELVDREVETLPSIELNQSKLDALIQFSQQTDKIGKALDRIRAFVMARALPGDWVQHDDKINVTGPAAERILSSLGLMGVPVSFTKWEYAKDTGTDKNGDWFNWTYWADVEIGGLKLGRIEGRCGSRDKFFGFEYGSWKDIADVKESDVRMSARRSVFKEAIKVSLGLRGIPADQASVLGLDPSKIKKVTFGSKKEGTAETGAQDEFVATVAKVTIKRSKPDEVKDGKVVKKGFTIFAIYFNNNVTAETFDTKIAEKAKELLNKKAFARTAAAKEAKYAATLVEIRTATAEDESSPADQAGDAQE